MVPQTLPQSEEPRRPPTGLSFAASAGAGGGAGAGASAATLRTSRSTAYHAAGHTGPYLPVRCYVRALTYAGSHPTALVSPPGLLKDLRLAVNVQAGVPVCLRCAAVVTPSRAVSHLHHAHPGFWKGVVGGPRELQDADVHGLLQDAYRSGGGQGELSTTVVTRDAGELGLQVPEPTEGLAVYAGFRCTACSTLHSSLRALHTHKHTVGCDPMQQPVFFQSSTQFRGEKRWEVRRPAHPANPPPGVFSL